MDYPSSKPWLPKLRLQALSGIRPYARESQLAPGGREPLLVVLATATCPDDRVDDFEPAW
jgi:hypothetical protein